MNRKNFVTAVSALFLTTALMMTPAAASSVATGLFPDDDGHWARPTIERIGALGIVTGDTFGKVNPDSNITRAEFVTILLRALDIKTNPDAPVTFTDIQGHWAKQTIATAYQLGMVNGVGAGKFAPDAPITRNELAKLLTTNAGSLETVNPGTPTFWDIQDNWGYSYIVTAYQKGLVQGSDANHYAPLNKAKRAEAIIMIERLLQGETKGTLPSPNEIDSLASKVNSTVAAFSSGTIPAGFSNNFVGPMQTIMAKVEQNQSAIPAGLPASGSWLEDTHAMTKAEHYLKFRTVTSTPGADGEKNYQYWDVYMIKRDGQWKIGDYFQVSE